MEPPTIRTLRNRLNSDLRSGDYVRNSGTIGERDWFNSHDMARASSYYGIKAAYTEQGSHWRLILSFKKSGDGYQSQVYDPLVGITNMTIHPERGISHVTFSPEMDQLYFKRREEKGVLGKTSQGWNRYMSTLEFLEEYLQRNPVPSEAINALRKRGSTQKDGHNCGPLAIMAAYEIKELVDDGIEFGEPRPIDESADDVIEIGSPRLVRPGYQKQQSPDDEIEVGKPRPVKNKADPVSRALSALRKKLEK